MKKGIRIFLIILGCVIVIVAAGATYLLLAMPRVKNAEDVSISATPEMVERGSYLANHVSDCMGCHTPRDWNRFNGPLYEDSTGAGGLAFDKNFGVPGVVYAKNITPYNLDSWTDGEILRALTVGVNKDGKPLFPLMPYQHFASMQRSDLYAIIAYLRTLPSVKKDIPASQVDFPLNFILHTIPHDVTLTDEIKFDSHLQRGAYLVNAAGCSDCHTPRDDKGNYLAAMNFAGGNSFRLPSGTVYTANITPDSATGIGKITREAFIARFKFYNDSNYQANTVGPRSFNTVMPWVAFSKMTEDDLADIYLYLKSLKPINHEVIKFMPNKD